MTRNVEALTSDLSKVIMNPPAFHRLQTSSFPGQPSKHLSLAVKVRKLYTFRYTMASMQTKGTHAVAISL